MLFFTGHIYLTNSEKILLSSLVGQDMASMNNHTSQYCTNIFQKEIETYYKRQTTNYNSQIVNHPLFARYS